MAEKMQGVSVSPDKMGVVVAGGLAKAAGWRNLQATAERAVPAPAERSASWANLQSTANGAGQAPASGSGTSGQGSSGSGQGGAGGNGGK